MPAEFGEKVGEAEQSFCYRHPGRESYVLCQRCGNTICPDCQTVAPVGVLCPDCAGQARTAAPSNAIAKRWAGSSAPLATYSVMGLCALVYVFQWLSANLGGPIAVTEALWYAPFYSLPQNFQPWRMVTSMFAHSPTVIFHILLNMYTLWLFGRQLEHFLGRGRFIALYLISGFAGSLVVQFWTYADTQALLIPVVGASGAIFGLLGAFLVIGRSMGGNMTSFVVLLAINIAIGFMPGSSIAWQAHVGGLLGGLVVGLIFMKTRMPNQRNAQIGLTAAFAGALVVLSFAFFVVSPVSGLLQ